MKLLKVFAISLMMLAIATSLSAQSNPNAIVGTWESDEKDVRMEYFQDGDHYNARLLWGNKIVEADNVTSKLPHRGSKEQSPHSWGPQHFVGLCDVAG